MKEANKGQIIVYDNKVEVRLYKETVWLSQTQISDLFMTERSVITKHLNNIFRTNELREESNVQKMHIARSDKPVKFYNLDVIISVGYRVNSKRGTQFRIWATNVLKKHLIDGYTINEKRLKTAEYKYQELQKSLKLLSNVIQLENVSDETKGIIQVISQYSYALDILDDFDHEKLSVPKGSKPIRAKFKLTYKNARKVIDIMKSKSKTSDLVGKEKDKSFESSINAIYQTFEGKDLYPTVEDKAAHLLYFITKNHSFIDGNKRIAAIIFIYFLKQNKILLLKDGSLRIDNNALVALTLMIAASKPSEKDTIIKVIINLLN